LPRQPLSTTVLARVALSRARKRRRLAMVTMNNDRKERELERVTEWSFWQQINWDGDDKI
jgi:hypothetical protein